MPAPTTGLELFLEGPGLEAAQDLRVRALGLVVAPGVLAVAPGVCYRSIANLHSKVSTICLEEITSELRAVIGDDAVGDPKTDHEALDELDCRASWDGADGFNLRPLSELVDGDVEVSIAPRRPRARAQNIQPPDRERP